MVEPGLSVEDSPSVIDNIGTLSPIAAALALVWAAVVYFNDSHRKALDAASGIVVLYDYTRTEIGQDLIGEIVIQNYTVQPIIDVAVYKGKVRIDDLPSSIIPPSSEMRVPFSGSLRGGERVEFRGPLGLRWRVSVGSHATPLSWWRRKR